MKELKTLRFCLIIILLCSRSSGFSQLSSSFYQDEDSLKVLFKTIRDAPDDSLKITANRQVIRILGEVLRKESSFSNSFDSLSSVSKLLSPDKRFRIISWILKSKDGQLFYFGFLQVAKDNGKSYSVIELRDSASTIRKPSRQTLDPDRWYGAIYYQIVPVRAAGITYYTMLGYATHDAFCSRKIIEVLYFEKDRPFFGAAIFDRGKEGIFRRVLLEYSATATISLRYDQQEVELKSKWNTSKRNYIAKKRKISAIVFDRIVPLDPRLPDDPRFFVPEGSIYDGYYFHDGMWRFIENIDAKNSY